MLIDEVVSSKLESIHPDLESIVKRSRAARSHALAKAKRQEEITKYAERTFQVLLDQIIRQSSKEAYFTELVCRVRQRYILRRWRAWAARQREDREAAIEEREQAYKSLGTMGLAGSSFAWSSTDLNQGTLTGSRAQSHSHTQMERLDGFAADVMLHQTERTRDHFYSPSTFIATTARHLAAIIQPPHGATIDIDGGQSSYSLVFQTIISPSQKSATPSADKAFEWLRSKFTPSSEGAFTQDGVTFESHILDRKDGFQTTCAGLLVFEAPLQTWSSEDSRTYVHPFPG
jgi:hypothetical protein